MRQLAPRIRQHAGVIDGAEFMQQRVARPDALGRRRVQEGKLLVQ